MSAIIALPRMGETMEAGRIAAWLKRPGDSFARGEIIAEIETDKVTVEMPALAAGRLVEILAPEGAEVAVGEPIGRYEAAEAAAPALAQITVPRMGESMEEGRLAAWLKAPGESFARGEIIAEIETDKVAVEMPALADGELAEIVVAPGETVAVGAVLALYRPRDDAPAAAPPPPAAAAQPAALPPAAVPPAPQAAPARPRATPVARRLARQAGFDLSALAGTGRRGRVESADVGAALAGPALSQDVRFVNLSQGRMAWREWGAPEASRHVLLLHGFSADAATWGASASALARAGAYVVAPDLPGHGATSFDAPTFDAVCAAVAAVAAFVRALQWERFDVVAHSMGAAVAARLAGRGEIGAQRLTLIAPAGLGAEIDGEFVAGVAQATTPGALSHLLRRLARRPPPLSDGPLQALAAQFAQGRLTALADDLAPGGRQGVDVIPDLTAYAGAVKIVWGLEDRIIPWTHCATAPSRAAVHLIAEAGHMPQWDKPQELAALL